ncbi:MAG: sulfate adenylyltransferase subunit CysD [Bacteriovoracaceae bacterium]|jgi:sulfate adenylyltransferase subunit 2|nr:sulfate adenylyltransferase subunit CysD [Bacteriovoracaceae bacterium]
MKENYKQSYLDHLEAQSIFIIREVLACAKNPLLLYSIGKDSSVLLHLLKKAFYPSSVPVKVMHVDTGWKFKEMIHFRDKLFSNDKIDFVIWKNEKGVEQKICPFEQSSLHTTVMKTQALKDALDSSNYDFIIGGARRDEEKSRAKERVFSLRDQFHQWVPRNQRLEFWNLYNTLLKKNDSLRVFPLSNWTEEDIWNYILKEKIEIVPLYFAKKRPVVKRQNQFIMVDDKRFKFLAHEKVEYRSVRFRTLGCYPLTCAIESKAQSVEEIIEEIKLSKYSERAGRIIDQDLGLTMEDKKKNGYF